MAPANLKAPFDESCCDGGACSDTPYQSALNCGCDPGLKPNPHYCERHQLNPYKEMIQTLVDADVGGEAPPSWYHLCDDARKLIG